MCTFSMRKSGRTHIKILEFRKEIVPKYLKTTKKMFSTPSGYRLPHWEVCK